MDAFRWTSRLIVQLTIVAGTSGACGSALAQAPAAPASPVPPPPPPPPLVGVTSATNANPGELPAQVFADSGSTAGAKPNAEAPDPKLAEAEAKKNARLQKIQQLTFDRRPSAILKAWATSDEAALKESKSPPPSPASQVSANVVPPGPGGMVAVSTKSATRVAVTATGRALRITSPPIPDPAGTTVTAASPVAMSPSVAQATVAPTAPDPFDDELFFFRRNVTKGSWPLVAKFLNDLPEAEGKAAYKRLIAMLPTSIPSEPAQMNNGMVNPQQAQMQQQQMMMMQQQQGGNPQFQEKTSLIAKDVIALAEAAPQGREKDTLNGLAQLLKLATDRGDSVENFIGLIKTGRIGTPPKGALLDREVAKILLASTHPTEMKAFLPEPEKAEADNDREALNLLSQYYLAIHAKEKKSVHLEQAWKVTLAVLAVGDVTSEQKDEALKRAVELAPKIREDLGLKWLEESFTKRPERGMEIVAAIGTAASRGLQMMPMNADARQKALELQKTAVEAILRSPMVEKPDPSKPATEADWSKSLGLLAGAWLGEAEFSQLYDTSTSLGPRMQRDRYGNFFYYDMMNNGNMMGRNNNFPQAIPVPKVLEAMPDPKWLARLDEGVRPKYAAVASQLYLKVGEDEKAFPHVEALAATHPELGRELAEEFLRVWTKNHDPNAERNMRNPYIYMFGFERKAESIPLTRSKQERNLKELAAWVAQLRKLPIRELDEKLIAKAFTACHSSAEVYRLDAIESVLGKFDVLKPETLAEMAEQMRSNLSGLWRSPNVQDQNKTKRKEKDIRAEVLRGYEVARTVVDQGLEKHPNTWALLVARAAIRHDENNYRQEIDPSSEFSKRRNEAMATFQEAARQYAVKAPSLSEDDETIAPYETWFFAGLGACDLGAINEKNQPDFKQPALIRQAILALPGESASRHMAKFANGLFTRMSALNPSVKFRYLKGGFDIVGDHQQAYEAKKVYDYYKDLVTEIKLEAVVDGSVEVGIGQPFGLFVNLKHTREIERESGGFGRYLQNQNTGNNFFYNYGRPLENYRDKFQDVVKKAFEEHFEVMSVTFQDEKVNSRATPEYGWRYTPYAYVLMKAKSPKVDKIPPVRLDLDFLDTSGYVIMPVESPAVPVDASTAKTPTRPFEKLQVTETLDERQAKDGKLILEVKATALGLVPPLEEVVAIKNADFQVNKTEDQGLSVSRFDPDNEANSVVSERTWLITMQAADGLPERPTKYAFPCPKVEGAETTYQRYVDADLAKVEPNVNLDERYGNPSRTWIWWTLGGIAIASTLGVLAYRFRPRTSTAATGRFVLPNPLTPFSVLGLLREIQLNDAVPDSKKRELAAAIEALESHYFAGSNQPVPDLGSVASAWIKQTT